MDALLKANQEMVKHRGMKATAAEIGMSEGALHSRMYRVNGARLHHEHMMRLQELSCTTRYAEAVAAETGGAFFKLPDAGNLEGADLSDKLLEMHEVHGLMSRTFLEAKKDDCIDASERAELEKIFHTMHQKTQEVRGVMFAVYCPQEA